MAQRMSHAEFIALMGVMFATVAFSIDAMLPALPEIGAELSPDDVNRAQLILTSFVLGMGIGTFFTGPLSDAFGRKRVIIWGAGLYIASTMVALVSSSLEIVLLARVLQGIGAAAPRIVTMAIIRDLYSGRQMARIVSIAMLVFTLFPAIAPAIGAGIIAFSGWRGIFVAFVVFAALSTGWMALRLVEPLAIKDRRPFNFAQIRGGVVDMMRHPTVRLSIIVQTLCLGALFSILVMVQPIYDVIFDRADSFPFWFGAVAVVSASASILNAIIVVRIGMRRVVTAALFAQLCLSGAMLVLTGFELPQMLAFVLFLIWQTSLFFMAGVTLGNLNAIAMEPMGHIAGTAASIIGAISTVGAAIIAAPIGLLFNGSLVPLAFALTVMCILALVLMLQMSRVEKRQPA